MATNEMCNSGNSPELSKKLEAQVCPDISNRLKELQALWIDATLFAQFEQRVKDIISKNPWSEAVVSWELQKTEISVENLFSNYSRQFRSILDHSANDDLYADAA